MVDGEQCAQCGAPPVDAYQNMRGTGSRKVEAKQR